MKTKEAKKVIDILMDLVSHSISLSDAVKIISDMEMEDEN